MQEITAGAGKPDLQRLEEAVAFGEEIGYPLIIRPAFTPATGGGVVHNEAEMREIGQRGLVLEPDLLNDPRGTLGRRLERNRIRSHARQPRQRNYYL